MTNHQRKYCEECGDYFRYNDVDSTDEAEACPVDGGHTVRDFVVEEQEA